MKTVFKIQEKPYSYEIKLEQYANGEFRLTYGRQVDDHLSYCKATSKLGQAIMHNAACEGLLDNDQRSKQNGIHHKTP